MQTLPPLKACLLPSAKVIWVNPYWQSHDGQPPHVPSLQQVRLSALAARNLPGSAYPVDRVQIRHGDYLCLGHMDCVGHHFDCRRFGFFLGETLLPYKRLPALGAIR